ncbi:MAG: DNA cytosine methyltransferase [Acidimicrobiia bacterium]
MRCVSLFSGCGGLDRGLQEAGFDIVFSADSWATCAESYKANFDSASFSLTSIEDLDEAHLQRVIKGGVELVAGGPPCPPFSKSRFYRTDKPRALQDPAGLTSLDSYMKVVELVKPRAFLLENVFGLAYKIHRPALEYLLERAASLGFECSWSVLNAADYGVPQIRERFFLVGVQSGVFRFPEPTHTKAPDAQLLDGLRPWVTAGNAIEDLDTEANASDEGHFAGGRYHDLLVEVPPGDNYLYFTEKRGHPQPKFEWRSRYWSFLLKLSPELPSWTIQARRSNNMGPFHWRNRILRISEIKRLQTFPDEWELAGKVEDQWRQVGNAVPPLLARRIGDAVRTALQT